MVKKKAGRKLPKTVQAIPGLTEGSTPEQPHLGGLPAIDLEENAPAPSPDDPSDFRVKLLAQANQAVRRKYKGRNVTELASTIYGLPPVWKVCGENPPRPPSRPRRQDSGVPRLPEPVHAWWQTLQAPFQRLIRRGAATVSARKRLHSLATLFWEIHEHLEHEEVGEAVHKIGTLADWLRDFAAATHGDKFHHRGQPRGHGRPWQNILHTLRAKNVGISFEMVWRYKLDGADDDAIDAIITTTRRPCPRGKGKDGRELKLRGTCPPTDHAHWICPKHDCLHPIAKGTMRNFWGRTRPP